MVAAATAAGGVEFSLMMSWQQPLLPVLIFRRWLSSLQSFAAGLRTAETEAHLRSIWCSGCCFVDGAGDEFENLHLQAFIAEG